MKKRFYLYMTAAAVVGAIVVIGVGGCNEDTGENHYNVEKYLGRYDADGTLSYGGQTYRTVKIGGQTWMAENMNYVPKKGNSWCYDNDPSNCAKYGRLYDWTAAMAVCPGGWRLPDTADWNTLSEKVGGTRGHLGLDYWGDTIWICAGVGKTLKSKSWNSKYNDEFGFSALPVGSRYPDDKEGDFHSLGSGTVWFTATEMYDTNAQVRATGWGSEDLRGYGDPKYYGSSVRCLKNN